jgi:hypothetical protein
MKGPDLPGARRAGNPPGGDREPISNDGGLNWSDSADRGKRRIMPNKCSGVSLEIRLCGVQKQTPLHLEADGRGSMIVRESK